MSDPSETSESTNTTTTTSNSQPSTTTTTPTTTTSSSSESKTQKRAPGSITRAIKCGIIGDGTVGKTTLLVSYTCRAFMDEYVPTLFDNFSAIEEVDGQVINMVLWDTAGQEDYAHLRATSYTSTDIFLLCFSTVHMDSFDNLKHKWIIELKANAPDTPFILVGTKTDLRSQVADPENSSDVISFKQGQKRAKELKALGYLECSSKDLASVNQVFIEAIKFVLDKSKRKAKKSANKEDKLRQSAKLKNKS